MTAIGFSEHRTFSCVPVEYNPVYTGSESIGKEISLFSKAFIVYGGDSALMIPAAAGVAIYLLTGCAYRLALIWLFLFCTGLSVVAGSKIAYVGWGMGIDAIDLHGISGHAMRTAAVMPVILYFILGSENHLHRRWMAGLGVACGVCMSVMLVLFDFHSLFEATLGFCTGIFASITFLCVCENYGVQKGRWLPAVFFTLPLIAMWIVHPVDEYRWINKAAVAISVAINHLK